MQNNHKAPFLWVSHMCIFLITKRKTCHFTVVDSIPDVPVPPAFIDHVGDPQAGPVEEMAATNLMNASIASLLKDCSVRVEMTDGKPEEFQAMKAAGAYLIEIKTDSRDNPEHVMTIQLSKNHISSAMLQALTAFLVTITD